MEGAMSEATETMPDGRIALRFERHLAHSREKVWRAITEVDRLREWFVDILDYDRSRLAFAPGAALTFASKGFAESRGEVTIYQPPALLEYTWGEEILRFELTPAGAGCLLVFTNVVDGPETAAAVTSGWSTGLDRLARALG
jgi:uncharacterized protein YndB with AHSA1/START domain